MRRRQLSDAAKRWVERHRGSADEVFGPSINMRVDYVFSDSTCSALGFTVALDEWNPELADEVVRVKFAELAQHMAADYPDKAAEISRALNLLDAPPPTE